MNVSTGFLYLKKCFNSGLKNVESKIKPLKETVPEVSSTGSDILSEQNRLMVLRQTDNYVEPLQKKFKSTKDMYRYAKQRCIEGLKQKYEHAVVMDTKNNIIIAEFKGNTDKCSLKCFNKLNIDMKNIVVMHGHPESYPISHADVRFLKDYGLDKVIAVDLNGEFSLVGKSRKPLSGEDKGLKKWLKEKKELRLEKSALNDYSANTANDYEDYALGRSKEWYKETIDDTLKHHAPKMGLRYITNYGYLINKNRTNLQ